MAQRRKDNGKIGYVVKFKTLDGFLRGNGGIKAVAYQEGGTFAVLAKNGNCTPFFNSDVPSIAALLGSAKFDSIPVR
jgi:hypothetical protein